MLEASKALGELLQLQAEGVKLPYSPERIIEIEQQGGVVDLDTGEILWGAADGDSFRLTEKGREHVSED